MVGQASCLSVQAGCLHHQIHKRYFSNSHIPGLIRRPSSLHDAANLLLPLAHVAGSDLARMLSRRTPTLPSAGFPSP